MDKFITAELVIVVLCPESTYCLEGEQSSIKGHIFNSSVYCKLNTNISQFAEKCFQCK